MYEEFTEPHRSGIPGIIGLRGQDSHGFQSPCHVYICCLSSLHISRPFWFALFSFLRFALPLQYPVSFHTAFDRAKGNIAKWQYHRYSLLFPEKLTDLFLSWCLTCSLCVWCCAGIHCQPLLTLETDWFLDVTRTFPFIFLNKAESQ